MKTVVCDECGGKGLVSDYFKEDFYGARECDKCSGKGTLFVTKTGALVDFPGGPFCGRISKDELQKTTV